MDDGFSQPECICLLDGIAPTCPIHGRAAPATGEAGLTGDAKTTFAKCDGEVFKHDGAWKCYKCGATGGAIANADPKTHTVATGEASPLPILEKLADIRNADLAVFRVAGREMAKKFDQMVSGVARDVASMESQLAALTKERDDTLAELLTTAAWRINVQTELTALRAENTAMRTAIERARYWLRGNSGYDEVRKNSVVADKILLAALPPNTETPPANPEIGAPHEP